MQPVINDTLPSMAGSSSVHDGDAGVQQQQRSATSHMGARCVRSRQGKALQPEYQTVGSHNRQDWVRKLGAVCLCEPTVCKPAESPTSASCFVACSVGAHTEGEHSTAALKEGTPCGTTPTHNTTQTTTFPRHYLYRSYNLSPQITTCQATPSLRPPADADRTRSPQRRRG